MNTSHKTKWIPYLFILPFIISFILFFIIPSVYSFILSFAKYPGYGTVKWIGIQNYRNILVYGRFWDAVWRTFFYWLVKFVPVTVISFLMALFLHNKIIGNRIKKIYKPVLFLPQVCAITASALVFMILFGKTTGAVNQFFGTDIDWIYSATYSKWIVLLMICWRAVGWFMVVYMSGLTSISPDINEAAVIDGANSLKRLLYITIPLMKPTFMFAFVMDAISSLRMYTEAAVLTGEAGGIARDSAEGVINLLMMNLNSGNFGMASAYGWIIFVIIMVMSLFIMSMFREREAR